MLYRSSYDSVSLRGIDDPLKPRPWDIPTLLAQIASKDKKLLDLGTGTGFKLLPLKKMFKEIYGIELSKSMVCAAKNNFCDNNMFAINGTSHSLPFQDNSFQVVSCMLSCWNPAEIHRVLTKDGVVIIEQIGCEDKKDLKVPFGSDSDGWRGQHLNFDPKDRIDFFYKVFNEYFKQVSIQNGFWDTLYSTKGVLKLLANTPTIRKYKYHIDKTAVKKAISLLKTPNGIKITQNRILIYAKNPK
ncbi:MAG: class I SAM-dependent methyltransferase [Gammaproteobacteria bacterium]